MAKIVPFRPRGATPAPPVDPAHETTSFEGPSRVHVRDWASSFSLAVSWQAKHLAGVPLVRSEGTIWLEPADGVVRSAGSAADGVVNSAGVVTTTAVGRLVVVKACLATGEDLEATLTEASKEHAELAADVFDRYRYSEEFETWCEEEHGQHPLEDPLFLVELELDPVVLDTLTPLHTGAHKLPLTDWVAALAAIDALALFGAVGSPLVTFEHGPTTRWLDALGATRWRPNVLVGFRPDP